MHLNSSSGLVAAREKRGEAKAHRIRAIAKVDGTGSEMVVWLGINKSDLEKARPGTGQRHSIGFALDAEVDIPGEGTFQLSSSWVALRAR